MKRRLVAGFAIALGSLGLLPLFAGQASAALPPIPPPGVVTPPPVSPTALNAGTQTACANILTKNLLATEGIPGPVYPVVGTAAFETRGELFCGI